MSDQTANTPPAEFSHWVSDALNQIYDSAVLQSHPLRKALFPLETNPIRRCQLLRKTLLDAIHSLEPNAKVPSSAPDWRLYRLVELRFIEGLNPNEAMTRLGLAKSQFYRDQSRAIEMLVEILWAQMPSGALVNEPDNARTQLINKEVERLFPSREGESIQAGALAHDLRQIILPLSIDKKVIIGDFNLDALNRKIYDRILLRQALLTALTAALDMDGVAKLHLRSNESGATHTIRVDAEVDSMKATSLTGILEQLETCRLLVEALGGRLSTTTGTRRIGFTLTFGENHERLLLVIDDNAGMADLFRAYLKGYVWHVIGASGGTDARNILREIKPDLILLDILMPQEDGWELLRMLKSDAASKDIPVIICSVLKQPQIALQLGARAYVGKPVSQQDLLDIITEFN